MKSMTEVLHIMARLRDPSQGCPWDREQTFQTIAPHTIEEAYEVADAIARGAYEELRSELGDLLFQVVFHARLAEEAQLFGFEDVARALADKLVRRHPHVFGDATAADAKEVGALWEAIKAEERRASEGGATSLLDGIPSNLPALSRAQKLQKRAAQAGFDWNEAGAVLDKLQEELNEARAALQSDRGALREELGDLLFTCVNLTRHAGVDAEAALREANGKFERRFRHVEKALQRSGRDPAAATLEELDALWEDAKRLERAGAAGEDG